MVAKSKHPVTLRKPPPATAEDFVRGEGTPSSAPSSKASPVSASLAPASGAADDPSVVKRKDGAERRRTTIYFSPKTARRLAVYCALREDREALEQSAVVEEAVAAWLDARESKRSKDASKIYLPVCRGQMV